MNERIRELAREAAGGLLDYTAEDEWKLSQNEAEKFAQLIARECANIVTDAVNHREQASTYADKIREHFGVAE